MKSFNMIMFAGVFLSVIFPFMMIGSVKEDNRIKQEEKQRDRELTLKLEMLKHQKPLTTEAE